MLFRTGQLIGGPDCGVLVGTKRFLDKIRKNGFDELFAPHSVDLSGLAKTFDLCRRREQAELSVPILRTLTTPTANLRNRSERLLPQIQGTSMVESASVEEIETLLYPDARYGRLPSVGVAIRGKGKSPSELASLLADQRPGLKVRIRRNDIVIDLKTVPPRLDSVIVQILENCK